MIDKFFKVLLVLVLVFSAILFIASLIDYFRICDEIKEENWDLRQQLRRCQEINPFHLAVREIGERTYRKEYDCLNHAVDLYDELERKGIKSSILISENREHAWIGVWIETTEGGFLNPSTDLKIIEIRDGDLNTICKCK